MTSDTTQSPQPPSQSWAKRHRAIRAGLFVAALAIAAAGGAFGSHAIDRAHPRSVLLLQPTAIAQVTKSGAVALKGKVAEIFGGKFILQDDSGRALVDTGPRGDGTTPATQGETVTVQGYYDRGVVHADVLTHADGTSEAFGPPGPPRGPHPGPGFGPRGAPPSPPAAP